MASKELKEKRRAQGLCVYCGRPAVIKADGTPARRCKECSGSHVRQKRDARHGIIPEQKTLLRYKKSRIEVLSAKATLKQLKLIAKAIKRQIPGYINIEKADDYSVAYLCACCRQGVPSYASYCPNCGQRISM